MRTPANGTTERDDRTRRRRRDDEEKTMSDTNGQPDPDIRTEPLEDAPLPDQDPGVGAGDPAGDSDLAEDASNTANTANGAESNIPATTSTAGENRAADEVDESERPRPSTDAETQEDTVSGGPAD
jgi:hypothetical protein